MIIIDIISTLNAEGNETISHAEPFPTDAIRIICDGTQYIVYQPGDEIPPLPTE